MKKLLLLKLFALVAAMMCALGASAVEAYACYTSSNTTLTFYYDNQRNNRTGKTYDLNTGNYVPGWITDISTGPEVTKVVFDSSFAGARPTTTFSWFYYTMELESITGMSYLNTSEVTNMDWMFTSCRKLTSLDLSSFNTSNVTNMSGMFFDCSNLRTIYVSGGWTTAAVTNSTNMFYNCSSLVGGQGTPFDANHTDKAYAHIDGGPSNPGYFMPPEAYACYTPSDGTLTFCYDGQRASRPGTTYDLNTGSNVPGWMIDGTNANVTKVVFYSSFANTRPTSTRAWFYGMENLQSITGMEYLNTSEVTEMSNMFCSCGLTSIDLSHFNTENVISMYAMFYWCQGLTRLDLSSFNTAKVQNMQRMFRSSTITSLDLSSFNTSSVTNMAEMFTWCSDLTTVYVGGGWDTGAVTSSSDMFVFCTSLVGGMGTIYDANHTDKAYAHIDGGPSNPGYFTAKNTGMRGDVNGDHDVNINDVTTLIDVVLGKDVEYNASAADCNTASGDGTVDINDVTELIARVLTGTW